jgi:hypothetical protein
MDINLSISSATSIISNYLVVAIYEETSPTVVVDFQSFAAPHTSSRNISFTGCNPVPHKVIIYENASAAVGGTIRHNFIYNPNFKNAQIREDLFILAGTTAGLSGTSYTDASLAGWTWSLERRGVGTLQKDVDYSWDSGTNTWQLLATSDNPTPSIETGEASRQQCAAGSDRGRTRGRPAHPESRSETPGASRSRSDRPACWPCG